MKILIVTSEWERYPGDIPGIHIRQQVERLREAGVEVNIFPFRGKKNPINYWLARRAFLSLDLQQYDVIHAQHGQAGIVALAQKIRPVVVTFHGSDLQGIRASSGRITLLGYALRAASRWVAQHANAVILVAPHLAQQLSPDIFYKVIPAGIDLDSFHPMAQDEARRLLNLPQQEKLILFVGNPARTEKRFWLAEKTVVRLEPDMHAKLVIAHDIPNKDMPLYMNACDALLVTSSTEGSPNAVKEALACNLPIVSTDVGDIRVRIDQIDGCAVCADSSPESLSEALRRILANPRRINGRAAVMAFDEKSITQELIAVYRNLQILK